MPRSEFRRAARVRPASGRVPRGTRDDLAVSGLASPGRTMPELPDVTIYCEALARRVVGVPLVGVRLDHPFLLRSVEPRLEEFVGRRVAAVERLGKRVVLRFEDELALVFHLMIAGRFHWVDTGARAKPRRGLVSLEFASGTLTLTEAGSKRRASLVAVRGRDELARIDRGGLEIPGSSPAAFAEVVTRENRTLKRALTDPRIVAGVGNAYSDEILHAARLSPMKLTRALAPVELSRLHAAAVDTLARWTERLRAECGTAFPEHVTAFRPDMAVHGRHGLPCPDCAKPVQRIVWADRECNYCAACQNEGRLLADRALSRLLRDDWPRTIEELEDGRAH